jgi:hypothetical protein
MSRVLILTKEGCCAEMFQCRLSICCHGLPARNGEGGLPEPLVTMTHLWVSKVG